MLRISYMKKRTNISVLDMLKIKVRLEMIYKQRITRFFGHIIISNGLSLRQMIFKRKIEKGIRGRTPKRWIDHIKTNPLKDVIKLTENRKCWKEIVANFNRRVT
jgi:hypothetical protein